MTLDLIASEGEVAIDSPPIRLFFGGSWHGVDLGKGAILMTAEISPHKETAVAEKLVSRGSKKDADPDPVGNSPVGEPDLVGDRLSC